MYSYKSDPFANCEETYELYVESTHKSEESEDYECETSIFEETKEAVTGSSESESDNPEVSFDYKQKAVKFWKEMTGTRSSKTGRKRRARTFGSVQHKFKKLKSAQQLNR